MAKELIVKSVKEKIEEAYIENILEKGHKPESIYAFCKKLKIKESDFYELYSSFLNVETSIWKKFFNQAVYMAKTEPIYPNYSAREKLLAIYYTWIEILKENRSYILNSYEAFHKPIVFHKNEQLAEFKLAFYDYANELLMEARDTREVEPRSIPQIMNRYPDLFWAKTLFIFDFWVNDTSKSFEKTDTLIEKSVNTVFDLLARSPLDSLLDLGKFIFQNRK